MLSQLLLGAAIVGLAAGFPQISLPPSSTIAPITSTTPPPSAITTAPGLTCTGGSTVKTTTECTYGNTYSYCYSAPPPLSCDSGYFPGTIQYGHCDSGQICYPVDASWITTTCPPNGETAYTTSTLFSGTLAGGVSTVISVVQCACGEGQYYSWQSESPYSVYCMPFADCVAGMTTSYSTNDYCLTVTTPSYCSGSVSTPYCACATGLPQYPAEGGAPTTCA
ncbi:hypothetical protein B0T24DRAFT_619005 [Lasiosphaeria ovina]|uniref:Uncharacterized protein n=1 Tax=Lasiosphaeria ovina TaxID=92902 RepID=A0AAE0KHX7_9PEZI|nr:hypothetical protein B0T24DRAFT_619005 [Lasiosphaeria ovina]